jgi:magnesium-transporting ATPase (P-type)
MLPVKEVVPGDVVVIQQGEIYCDMVLLKGNRLLIDESALTGESTPVVKTILDTAARKVKYDRMKHKGNTVMAGTFVLELDEDEKCLGLVMTTGSFTGKGELLSEVLSYERHKLKFDDDVLLVLFILLVEMIVLVSLVFNFLNDSWVFSWFYGIYVFGTVLPPLLPTCFVVSVGISADRLRMKHIACSNPEGILIAGKVDTAFFDKTGTLTKQGLDFLSVDATKPNEEWILVAMAVCHTLGTRSDGSLLGNHVDEASFEFTGASLHMTESGQTCVNFHGKTYTVLKHFVFDCVRTTQSVIIQDEDGSSYIFVKGSSDAIEKICDPMSIPGSFVSTVRESAKSGIYQLAVAMRPYDLAVAVHEASRDDIEKSLSFIGFVNFQNCKYRILKRSWLRVLGLYSFFSF